MELCEYGCGLPALFTLKSGKKICAKSFNSCPTKRKKQSDRLNELLEQGLKKVVCWNKGMTGRTYEELYGEEQAALMKENLREKFKNPCSDLSEEEELVRRAKISTAMKANPNGGGLRTGSGRGKKGRYKGYWCDSSWELAWVIYNIDNNVFFERNTVGFEYKYNNLIKKYYPDFILSDGSYVEIKGRRSYKDMDELNKEKIQQFPHNLKVLCLPEMASILNYVISKYGKEFYTLYE
jgi:hypothetical protein